MHSVPQSCFTGFQTNPSLGDSSRNVLGLLQEACSFLQVIWKRKQKHTRRTQQRAICQQRPGRRQAAHANTALAFSPQGFTQRGLAPSTTLKQVSGLTPSVSVKTHNLLYLNPAGLPCKLYSWAAQWSWHLVKNKDPEISTSPLLFVSEFPLSPDGHLSHIPLRFSLKILRINLLFLTSWLCIHLPSPECLYILFCPACLPAAGKTLCFNDLLNHNYHIMKGWTIFITSSDGNSSDDAHLYL